MSTTRTKTELVRMAWITALRTQGHRKCTGQFVTCTESIVSVCALGLLAEVAGIDFSDLDMVDDPRLMSAAGLTSGQCFQVFNMNDGSFGRYRKHTFAEIADVVESWFATDKAG